MCVDGGLLKVTPAVGEILKYRQTFWGTRLFWIDAVCINQQDVDERSIQVPLMREIYQGADRVVVWLGPMANVIDASGARGQLMQIIGEANSMTPEEHYKKIMTVENPGWYALNELLEVNHFHVPSPNSLLTI